MKNEPTKFRPRRLIALERYAFITQIQDRWSRQGIPLIGGPGTGEPSSDDLARWHSAAATPAAPSKTGGTAHQRGGFAALTPKIRVR